MLDVPRPTPGPSDEPGATDGDALLGRTLLREGALTPAQLEAAIRTQADLRARGETLPLGDLLVRSRALTPEHLKELMALAGRTVLSCPSCARNFNIRNWAPGRDVLCPTCSVALVRPAADRTIDAGGGDSKSRARRQEDPLDSGGTAFGPYRLLEELGRGGMGVVWKAWDPRLRRIVALKQVLGGDRGDPAAVERFIREAQLAAKLRHPNIVGVHDVGEEDGAPYFTTDYIQAQPLDRIMKKPVPVRQAVEWVRAAAEALAYAHEQGVVHRDVKPSNLLIDARGRLFVMDFGLAAEVNLKGEAGARRARLTVSGQLLGTPQYMSPEQARGLTDRLGPETDQFSLGVVLYELLAGRLPFRGDTVWDLLRSIGEDEPVPPGRANRRLHRDLETICLKAIEKPIERRYATMADLAADLGRWLEGEPIQARPLSTAGRLLRRASRHRAVLLPTAAAALLAVAFGGWAAVSSSRRSRQVREALERAAAAETAAGADDPAAGPALERNLDDAREAFQVVLALEGAHAGAKRGLERVEHRLSALRKSREDALVASRRQAETADRNRRLHEEAGELLELGRKGLDAATLSLYDRNVAYADLAARVEEGQKHIEAAIGKAPDLALAHHLLGRCWDLRGYEDRAEECWRTAIRLRPEFGPAHYELGRVLLLRAFQLSLGTTQEEREANRVEAGRCAELGMAELEAARHGVGFEDPLQRAVGEALLAHARADRDTLAALAARGIRDFDGKPGVEEFHWLAGLVEQQQGLPARGYDVAIQLRPTHAFALFCRANTLKSEGDLTGAIRDNSEALRFRPRWAAALYNRAAALLESGDTDGALSDYSACLELRPDWAVAWGSRASAWQAKREWDRAIADSTRALDLSPRLSGALHNRGLAHRGKGDLDAALRDFSEALALNPREAKSWAYRASVRKAKGDLDGAIADSTEALALDPRNADTVFFRGLARDAKGDLAGAIRDYDAALGMNPKLVEAWYSRGGARMDSGDLDGAIADYDEALRIDPAHTASLANRGAARFAKGDVEGLLADCTEAIRINPRAAAAYSNRGIGKKALGDLDGALRDLEEAVRLDPAEPEAWNHRGVIRKARGDLRGALEDATAALALNPRYPEALFNRSLTRSALRDFRGAVADCTEALRIKPRYADALASRGDALKALGDLDAAIADYDAALAIQPAFPAALINRGGARQQKGDLRGAIEDATAALALLPDSPEALLNRASARYGNGDDAASIADCTRALAVRPNLPEALLIRGLARKRGGDLKGAQTDLETLLKTVPEGWTHRALAEKTLGEVRSAAGGR